MSADWDRAPIGDLCHLINGRAFKPSDWSKRGLPIVRIQNLNDPTKPYNHYDNPIDEKYIIENGDILLSWSGTPGTSFGCFLWNRGRALLNQHIFKVHIDNKRIDAEFFVNAINYRLDEMIAQAHGGVGLRHITKKKLESIEIPLPSLPEQRRIVARIKEMVARVDEIRKLREEALKKAEVVLGAIFHHLEKDQTWPLTRLADILKETKNGRSIRSNNKQGNGYVLTIAAVRDFNLDCNCRKSVELDNSLIRAYAVKKNDVFVSRSNTTELVGLSAISAQTPPPRTIYPDLLIRLTPDSSRVLPRYLAFALRFPSVRKQIRESAKGTSQSMVKISGTSLKEILIPLPTIEEQKQLIVRFDHLHKVYSSLRSELSESDFSSLSKSILHKAFAGEL